MPRMRLEFDVETNGWGFLDREIVEETLNEKDSAGRHCYAVEKLMETLDHILRCEPHVVVSDDPRFTLGIVPSQDDDNEDDDEGFRLRPEDEDDA